MKHISKRENIFKTFLIKILARYFVDLDKITLKFIWQSKGITIVQVILKQKNKEGGITLPNFKTYNIVIVKNTVWCGQQDRHIND